MNEIFQLPGLWTESITHQGPCPPAYLYERGYRWIAFQTQNGDQIRTPQIQPWIDAGFVCGAWGVSYDTSKFGEDTGKLIEHSKNVGCDKFIISDLEECLKFAPVSHLDELFDQYRTRLPKEAARALSTLGAAWGENTYPIDYEAFLNEGFDIMPQAYTAWSLAFLPSHVLEHSVRAGIPLDRVHLTILSTDEHQQPPEGFGRPQTPEEIVADLRACDYASPDISIFTADAITPEYAKALEAITLQHTPQPGIPVPTTPAQTRAAMLKLGNDQEKRWVDGGLPSSKLKEQRITLADEILAMNDTSFNARKKAIQAAVGV